jgi:S1-C subfamily serine protease
VHLAIADLGSLAGQVTYADGTRPEEMQVMIRDESKKFFREETFYHTAGAFSVDDLPGGTFAITVATVLGLGVTTATIAPGEHRGGIAITLDRSVAVSGRLVDAMTKIPLPGYAVMARAERGAGAMMLDPDSLLLSDVGGHFAILAPPGQCSIYVWPTDIEDRNNLCRPPLVRTIDGPIDLGDLPVVLARLHGEPEGHLGFEVEQRGNAVVVTSIEPKGPAASSGLEVGSVITSIDGVAMTGELAQCGSTLLTVPAGTKVAVGLAQGVHVVVAAP